MQASVSVYRELKSAGDGYGNFLKMMTIAATQRVMGIATNTDHATARFVHLSYQLLQFTQ